MNSVTEILDYSCPPYLAAWFKKNSAAKCEQIAKETADCGTLVNRLIEDDILKGSYVSPIGKQDALTCLAQWEILKREHPNFVPSVKRMQTELKAFGIVGHPDFENEEATGWGITDLKCTSGIRLKNWIQEAQYARMKMDMESLPFPSFIRTIRLPRDGSKYEWVEIRDERMIRKLWWMFDAYYQVFLSEKVINEFFRQQNENLILGEI